VLAHRLNASFRELRRELPLAVPAPHEVFTRFIAKVFLTDALRYFGGAAGQCEIDNTSVVVAHGSGAKAVMAPSSAHMP